MPLAPQMLLYYYGSVSCPPAKNFLGHGDQASSFVRVSVSELRAVSNPAEAILPLLVNT